MKEWFRKLKHIWALKSKFGVFLLLVLVCATVMIGSRTFLFVQTLVDANLTFRLETLASNQVSLEKDISLKQQELLEKKKEYDTVLSSVLPPSISTGYIPQILDKIGLAVAQDITLTGIVNQEEKTEKNGPYSVYPVEATFVLSKDALSKLLTILSQAGNLDKKINSLMLPTGEVIILPLITLEHITIEGDMGDQYDASGNKLKNQITAKLLLHFYSQSS